VRLAPLLPARVRRRLRPSELEWRVRTVLVELHDRRVPELRADTDRLRDRIQRDGLAGRIQTDWR
jgi:hypothetical protein